MRYFLIILLISAASLFANGVAIVNAEAGTTLHLLKTETDVRIENQVAIVTTTQTFKNTLNWPHVVKYAYPLTDSESATSLSYRVNGVWYDAIIAATPADPTQPGGGSNMDYRLKNYLGATPLYYNVFDGGAVMADSTLVTTLTYVQLLPYADSKCSFKLKNNYRALQNSALQSQIFNLELVSSRSIIEAGLTADNHNIVNENQTANAYTLHTKTDNLTASYDYNFEYKLSNEELGVWGLSTYIDAENNPDSNGQGYFVLIAEPDGSETAVINKHFTFVIDKSGSMYGNKIDQAKQVARYIVNNLNANDHFNIVTFSGGVESFSNEHVPVNASNVNAAISYINNIYASGGTNISGAFSEAIPDFAGVAADEAKIIIFLTDGQATNGITSNGALVQHINDLVENSDSIINIHTFGIGNSFNQQLLATIASENSGYASFVENSDLNQTIASFFNHINNPVLINPTLNCDNENIHELYPPELPNIYLGEQLVMAGRYNTPGTVPITFAGTAFNQNINYDFNLDLSDSFSMDKMYILKIWAKKKIEYLLVQHAMLPENSAEQEQMRNLIVEISQMFGVISPFTSFTGGVVDAEDETEEANSESVSSAPVTLLGNYPNPFNPTTQIKFNLNKNINKVIYIKIYNAKGQLVKILSVKPHGKGEYSVTWNGIDNNNKNVASGVYFYCIDYGEGVVASKMLLLK